jgi:hypothetical protein
MADRKKLMAVHGVFEFIAADQVPVQVVFVFCLFAPETGVLPWV